MNEEVLAKAGNERKGFSIVYHELWTHYLPVIGKDALLFYLYLLHLRNTDKRNPRYKKAWPSRQKIIDDLSISPKQLPLIDLTLTQAELIDIEEVPSGRGKDRIQYIVHDPQPSDLVYLGRVKFPQGNTKDSDGKQINNYVSTTNDKELKKITPKEFGEYNSKDILKYFADKYFDKYSVKYVSNYSKDGAQVKSKLLPAFGAEKLIKIIDYVIAFYSDKWASPEYPRPTIGQLVSWLANKAAAFIDDTQPVGDAHTSDQPFTLDYETLKREGKL